VPQAIIQAQSALLTIYDNNGAAVKTETLDISGGKANVDAGALSKGIYNVSLTANGKQFFGRVVIQ
jgi:hypothetical protein